MSVIVVIVVVVVVVAPTAAYHRAAGASARKRRLVMSASAPRTHGAPRLERVPWGARRLRGAGPTLCRARGAGVAY